MVDTKLYYESHVTIEPVFDDKLNQVRDLASYHGFRVADLLMKKRKDDTEERSKNDTFATGHSKNFQDIYSRTKELIVDLQNCGFKVWRYKIEDTILDSKFNDDMGLLK